MRTFSDYRGEILFNVDTPPFDIKQCFTSKNVKNVLRGLHCSPYAKFITVNSGKIFDVVVKPDGSSERYILEKGDTLFIEAHCAHGYFCFEDTEIIYFLNGTFNNAHEKNYLWNDTYFNIKWPQETEHAIISEKDMSHEPIDTVILGPAGYLGNQLLKYIPGSVGLLTRLEDTEKLREQLRTIKPLYVVSAAGISGKPTIDWCEHNKEETMFVNVTCQLQLIEICSELGIHLTLLGSGAVFDGEKLFTETDEPNYEGTFYSKCRVHLENNIRQEYLDRVLYLRILYPITGDGDPRCFFEKLKKRADHIHDTTVSVTLVPLLFPKIKQLLKKRVTGILNFVNDGTTTLSNILKDVEHTVCFEKSNRGQCCLDVSKLKTLIS